MIETTALADRPPDTSIHMSFPMLYEPLPYPVIHLTRNTHTQHTHTQKYACYGKHDQK